MKRTFSNPWIPAVFFFLLTLALIERDSVFEFVNRRIAGNLEGLYIVSLIIIYCSSLLYFFYMECRRGIQRQRLQNLAKEISELKQIGNKMLLKINTSAPKEELEKLTQKIQGRPAKLSQHLAQLDIPSPHALQDTENTTNFSLWITYLDMLLPLALVGNVSEARLVLDRVQGKQIKSLWHRMRR